MVIIKMSDEILRAYEILRLLIILWFGLLIAGVLCLFLLWVLGGHWDRECRFRHYVCRDELKGYGTRTRLLSENSITNYSISSFRDLEQAGWPVSLY
jgi:hypothetical protein